MDIDNKWARFNATRNATASDLPGFIDAFEIQSDQQGIYNLLNNRPLFLLKELLNMIQDENDKVRSILKTIHTKLISDDVNSKLLAERFAKDPILSDLLSRRRPMVEAILQYHHNDVTTDDSYNIKGVLKGCSGDLQPLYKHEKG